MFCTKCGAKLEEGSRFCTRCGTPTGAAEAPRQPAPPKPQPEAPEPKKPPKEEPQPKPPKKGGAGKAAAVILILVVLAALAAVFVLRPWESMGRDGEAGTESSSQTDGSASNEGDGSEPEIIPLEDREPVDLQIRQIDNSAFPTITFYASVTDQKERVVDGLLPRDFVLTELVSGTPREQTLSEVKQIQGQEICSVGLVLDASGSMSTGDKMAQAKAAAKSFLNQVDFAGGDQIEVVSFSDYVYLEQGFTSDAARLANAIDGIQLEDMTALYDGLYSTLVQTYDQRGARCVIAFTDGLENYSSYTREDVVELSRSSGIPVYLVGIGNSGDYDAAALTDLAHRCSGEFFAANGDITSALADIYTEIYRQQQEYYMFRYTTTETDVDKAERNLALSLSDYAAYTGSDDHDYRTQALINENFGIGFRDRDYMLENSSVQEVTDADLEGLSLAQLRIARNEIYARHGRQFKDPFLNQWFYSKDWYLSIHPKYAPAVFDGLATPLSKLEQQNVAAISKHEKERMASYDIYPNAAATELTQYDLALSKTVLQTALEQMRGYRGTEVLKKNIAQVEAKINEQSVSY